MRQGVASTKPDEPPCILFICSVRIIKGSSRVSPGSMKVLFLFLLWSPLGSATPKKAAAAAAAAAAAEGVIAGAGDGAEWQNDGEEVAGAGPAAVAAAAELAIWRKWVGCLYCAVGMININSEKMTLFLVWLVIELNQPSSSSTHLYRRAM